MSKNIITHWQTVFIDVKHTGADLFFFCPWIMILCIGIVLLCLRVQYSVEIKRYKSPIRISITVQKKLSYLRI